jgi:hypothetical protein
MYNLHNLSIDKPIGNEYIAIVPASDDRAEKIIDKYPTLHSFINNFTNQHNHKYYPNILMVNDKASKSVFNIEAIAGFRNIIAICSIVNALADSLVSKVPFSSAIYSNYFDFYPIYPGKDYKYLLTDSPAVKGLDTSSGFNGQSSPDLFAPIKSIRYDEEILLKLLNMWEQRYVQERKTWKARVLFRSLEMAYQASSLPFKNLATIYDYGSLISLWVSAFEILVHPGKIGRANLTKVIDLLDYDFTYSNNLKKRIYSISISKKIKKVTLVQKIYYQIYTARNDFLHGNPVTMNNLFVFNKNKRRLLNHYAPLLYEVALIKFLNIYHNKTKKIGGIPMSKFMKIHNMKEALLSALKERK